jgi:CHAT domain-containing protein/tetratricopeptide (TPR) repeat protein
MAQLNSPTLQTRVLHLEVAHHAEGLKISLTVQQAGETKTVRQVEELAVPMERINQRYRQIVAHLNRANRQGRLTIELLQKLKESGQLFRDELFSAHIKEQISTGQADQLILTLDDQLVHVPWELLHDGQRFLCQQFAMGRVVRTRQPMISAPERVLALPLKMLVLADPDGDLKAAYNEGICIRDFVETLQDNVRVGFRSEGAQADFIRAKLRQFDIVHFAGHADYDEQHPERSGWRLGRERLTAADILKMAGTGNMPALIFVNGCQSARADMGGVHYGAQVPIFGLANAFILSGVKHYLGTSWEIPDDSSRQFAIAFYHHLFKGFSVGTAVRAARQMLIDQLGEHNIIWASYMLYGDPTARYLEKEAQAQPLEAVPSAAYVAPSVAMNAEMRAPEDIFHLAPPSDKRPFKKWLAGALLGLLLAAALIWVMVHTHRKDPWTQEQQAWSAFHAGDYQQVTQTCRTLQEKRPQRAASYVLLGHVRFLNGDLNGARSLYEHAVRAEQGTSAQKAEAHVGLGRIASEERQIELALQHYRQAADLSPDQEQPYVAQALLMNRQQKHQQAIALLNKARHVSSDPAAIDALTRQIEAKRDFAGDHQRLQRIDGLIEALQRQVAEGHHPQSQKTWSSRPLTLWLMEITTRGHSLQESAEVLLTSHLMDRLMHHPCLQIVERALMDSLMTELKLGASNIIDTQTALPLGRLVAARLILFGRMVHSGPHTQVTLRCIETETGRVTAIVNTTFDQQTAPAVMARRIADELIPKIQAQFPLRAVVRGKSGSHLILDVGRLQGVTKGMTFMAADQDVTVEVVTVDTDQCATIIKQSQDPIQVGLRMEAVR